MLAVQLTDFGGPENLFIGEYPAPVPGERELLIRVHATALNRADLHQRRGHYPPPPGDSPILGLEVAGEVIATGTRVSRLQPGDRVFALVGGGGYARQAVVHESMAMPIPAGMSFATAAAIPEAFLTAFQALFWLGDLQEGASVLIHAGGSGVGTAAIQLAKKAGATVWVTASAGKCPRCRALGADHAIDYRTIPFADHLLEKTAKKGVNLVVDVIGSPYFQDNLRVLSTDGRLVILAMMGGAQLEQVNLGAILRKRLQITGSTLRNRSADYKIRLTEAFQTFALDDLASGRLAPVIDSVLPWTSVQAAHLRMERNENFGKIVLEID